MSSHVPRRRSQPRLSRQTAWWLVPLGVLVTVEVANFMFGSNFAHPTLSKLADPLLEGYTARSAMYFGWLVAFWGLVRR
jgi:hypothetical protein